MRAPMRSDTQANIEAGIEPVVMHRENTRTAFVRLRRALRRDACRKALALFGGTVRHEGAVAHAGTPSGDGCCGGIPGPAIPEASGAMGAWAGAGGGTAA